MLRGLKKKITTRKKEEELYTDRYTQKHRGYRASSIYIPDLMNSGHGYTLENNNKNADLLVKMNIYQQVTKEDFREMEENIDSVGHDLFIEVAQAAEKWEKKRHPVETAPEQTYTGKLPFTEEELDSRHEVRTPLKNLLEEYPEDVVPRRHYNTCSELCQPYTGDPEYFSCLDKCSSAFPVQDFPMSARGATKRRKRVHKKKTRKKVKKGKKEKKEKKSKQR